MIYVGNCPRRNEETLQMILSLQRARDCPYLRRMDVILERL